MIVIVVVAAAVEPDFLVLAVDVNVGDEHFVVVVVGGNYAQFSVVYDKP